jgi:hypothetical protein
MPTRKTNAPANQTSAQSAKHIERNPALMFMAAQQLSFPAFDASKRSERPRHDRITAEVTIGPSEFQE